MTDASASPAWLQNWHRQEPPPPKPPKPPKAPKPPKLPKAKVARPTPPATGAAPTELPPGKWVKGMRSPNPEGRKPGIIDKRQKLQNALAEDAQKIVDVVVSKALEGDMQACSIVLARLAPPLKAAADKVQFELSKDAPLSEQANQILEAVAAGAVDPETGKLLIGCIQSVAAVRAIEDLESRILQLEAKQIG